ncbi:DsbA family protein [Streptomyces hokutonensis]|uniref:DsbA family protein n=1 Tax=Streptomyces hokutonensis TaxID=1306990 RepID=UPI0036B1DDF6
MPSTERASLRVFADDNAHRIRIDVVSAGLCTGARALPITAHPHLSAERGTLTRLTGAAFGTGHDRALAQGTTVLDSTAAAAGPAAPRDQPGVDELDAAEAMQRAWFVDRRSLSEPEVYQDTAVALDPDADAVTAAYRSPAGRVKARAGFRALRGLRGLRGLRERSYPTLLLDTAHGADQMGGAASTAVSLTAALDQRLTTAIPQVPFHALPSQGDLS